MTASPEKEEEVPDLQLSFVFGNSVVIPQTPHIQPEDAEPQEPPEYYTKEFLPLSRTNLKHVPQSILKNTCSAVKYLYLEGNQISSIPGLLFISLPNMLWLDLRKNQIASLPAEIGLHRSLRTLLLEGNPVSELPPELGNVTTLTGLNLRDCPITFPPRHIVSQGYQSILRYLRSALAERPVSVRRTPPELPVVEKLQLLELLGSSMEEQDESVDGSVDEDELQRFRELKHQMILLDEAELGSIAPGDGKPMSRLPPVTHRKKATAKAGTIPELPPFDTRHWRRLEERRQATTKELKEKQGCPKQRRKSMTARSHETLRKWRTQAKSTQEKKISEDKKKTQRKQKETKTDSEPHVEDSSGTQTPSMSITECEKTRPAWPCRSACKVERQISGLVEKMQERRRNPKGKNTAQMVVSEEDVAEVRKLQARLQEKKKNMERDLQKCFIIFSENTSSFLDN